MHHMDHRDQIGQRDHRGHMDHIDTRAPANVACIDLPSAGPHSLQSTVHHSLQSTVHHCAPLCTCTKLQSTGGPSREVQPAPKCTPAHSISAALVRNWNRGIWPVSCPLVHRGSKQTDDPALFPLNALPRQIFSSSSKTDFPKSLSCTECTKPDRGRRAEQRSCSKLLSHPGLWWLSLIHI